MFHWTVASIGLFELTEGLSLSVAGRLDADHPAGPGRSRPTPRRLHQEVRRFSFTKPFSSELQDVLFC